MEFERNELNLIRFALEERQRKIQDVIKTWETMEWNNIERFKEMYADKQVFEEVKESTIIKNRQEYEDIEELLERIYEEI